MKNYVYFFAALALSACTAQTNPANEDAVPLQAGVNQRLLDRAKHAELLVAQAEEKIAQATEQYQQALAQGDSSLETLGKKAWVERAQMHLMMVQEDIMLCREAAK